MHCTYGTAVVCALTGTCARANAAVKTSRVAKSILARQLAILGRGRGESVSRNVNSIRTLYIVKFG
jgi:hypothetical protein